MVVGYILLQVIHGLMLSKWAPDRLIEQGRRTAQYPLYKQGYARGLATMARS